MNRSVCLAILAACFTFTHQASGVPVSLTLTLSPTSSITVVAGTTLGISGSISTSLAGTQDITLFDREPISTALSFDASGIGLVDQTLLIDLGPIGFIQGGFVGVQPQLQSEGPIPLTFTGGTYNYSFDPSASTGPYAETSFVVNSGLLTYQGSGVIGALLGSGTLDFATNPIDFTLPPLGEIGVLTQTLLGASGGVSTYQVVLSAPLSASQIVSSDPILASATVYASILGTGTYIVPEPATALLLGIGMLGLLPVLSRLRRK